MQLVKKDIICIDRLYNQQIVCLKYYWSASIHFILIVIILISTRLRTIPNHYGPAELRIIINNSIFEGLMAS